MDIYSKNITTLLSLWLLCTAAGAQSGALSGRILDFETQEGIEYASISLYNLSDSILVDGTITDEMGIYTFTGLPQKQMYLIANFLGYEPYHSAPFSVTAKTTLDDISLGLNQTNLNEVVVTGRAATSVHKLDKQIYDASQFQNAKGGTASDVLRNLPSVTVNSFGEISVRGATGFLVMINGKPIQGPPSLILQQISANSIDDIEVVTAPSAKYDPDGNAGIINIKTRVATTDGTYLVANILAGLPSIEPYSNKNKTPRYGADLTFNHRQGKWDVSAGLDYRRYDISGRREGYVNTYTENVLTEFPSDGERSFDEINYSARASVSYAPRKNQSLTAGIYAGKRTKDRTADILYLNQQRTEITQNDFLGTEAYSNLYQNANNVLPTATPISRLSYFNENLRVRKSDFFIGSLDYAYQFGDESQLKISALYERTVLGGPTDNANLAYPNTDKILQLQFNDNDNPLDGLRLQLDYKRTLGENTWESGYQFRHLQHPGDFQYFDRDLANDRWIENPLFTNSINLTRNIHSAYSQISGAKDKWKYSAGLRLEYFDRTVDIARPDETFTLDKLNLFPSLNLGYTISEGLSLKLGYNRRIERTTTFKMTPFPEREHSETLEQGDAELRPEYIDLFELGIVKEWKDMSVFATGYYRHVDNVINRVNTVFNDTILNRIYTNVGSANAVGLEIGTTLYPTKKWRIYLGGNVYNYQIKGQLFDDAINASNTVYSINANTNIDVSPTFGIQLAFNYLSERITAQGRDSEFYNPSLSLQKTFHDKKIAVALQWLNIDMGLWNANEQRITTVRDNFFTTTNYVYEVDILQLNFTYQLNQQSKKINLPESEFGKKEF